MAAAAAAGEDGALLWCFEEEEEVVVRAFLEVLGEGSARCLRLRSLSLFL